MRAKRKKQQFLQKNFTKRMQKKLVMLFIVIILAFVILTIRITYINATHGKNYSKVVLDQQQYDSRPIPFKRGDILDRSGMKLATSERVYNVILDASVLLEKKDYIESTKVVLKQCFGIEEAQVETILEENPKSAYNILLKNISYSQAEEFWAFEEDDKNKIAGVWLENAYIRTYPYGSLASDVIGFVVDGNVGNIGIENSYNSVLNGADGREYGYFNEDATVERTVKEPRNGNTVVTTLDLGLQNIVERKLQEFNEAYKDGEKEGPGAKNVAVLIMDPNTGAVLAMSSIPNFDLNVPRDLSTIRYNQEVIDALSEGKEIDALDIMWRNFCVTDVYEPGSTMKPFTVAAAIETGAIRSDEEFFCGGYLHIGGYNISCVKTDGHGMLTVSEIISNSCNVGTMQVAEKLGKEQFCRFQSNFGFGNHTDLDLPGDIDTSNVVRSAENMQPVDLATNAFGQNLDVTMVQLATGFCSLINGGNYYQPHIMDHIMDENENTILSYQPILIRKTISVDTSNIIKEFLYATVEEGSGQKAQIEGYAIGGKTGTAEKQPREDKRYLNSFVAYAPQEKPEILIYTIIDEPNLPDQAASSLTCELTRSIMEEAFPYLNITRGK